MKGEKEMKYTAPEFELVKVEDIIATSVAGDDNGNNNTTPDDEL